MNIEHALANLNPSNDLHWTAEGLPRIDAVVEILGHDVKRKQITEAAPGFTREVAQEIANEQDVADDAEAPADPGEDTAPIVDDEPDEYPREELEKEIDTEESALDMPLPKVLASYALTMRAQAELDAKNTKLLKRLDETQKEIREISTKSEYLRRNEIRHLRANPSLEKTNPVKDYLEACQRARIEKAEKAKAFIESGTSARDVADQLNLKSGIDQALGNRKSARGSSRPVHPVR